MNIYVDFDDCLCETGRYFSGLVAEMYGKNIPYEDIRYFDLQKSFSLTDEQYEQMMIEAHRPASLLSFAETPGASTVGLTKVLMYPSSQGVHTVLTLHRVDGWIFMVLNVPSYTA